METKKSSFLNMVLTLGLVTLVAAVALGYVYDWTEEPIALAKLEKQKKAIEAVVAEYNNDPIGDSYKVGLPQAPDARKKADSLVFYPAKMNGELQTTAIKTYSMLGYSGKIELMVGFDRSNKIFNIQILGHKETPGLGSKISDEGFLQQYLNKSPKDMDLKVKKDGGDVDAISGATISSRAVSDAIELAFENIETINNEK
ncbi:MAG: RnfABCDGE type electron transport complex subunit G [Cyclobacteriaceae bacterium]